ncbi:hypothetical protein BJ875DRAFT_95662 [Amylocarpus encephaloides]|uniref:Uncharacterized protein n=1 Tax=Amylocarpus encephaloides TaxID=45428 RepID=A0A9P8C8P5_9HELO|nr:hypothetical protein BJ875DRAFT_95662 [Amylocarpus encephaloides]
MYRKGLSMHGVTCHVLVVLDATSGLKCFRLSSTPMPIEDGVFSKIGARCDVISQIVVQYLSKPQLGYMVHTLCRQIHMSYFEKWYESRQHASVQRFLVLS